MYNSTNHIILQQQYNKWGSGESEVYTDFIPTLYTAERLFSKDQTVLQELSLYEVKYKHLN